MRNFTTYMLTISPLASYVFAAILAPITGSLISLSNRSVTFADSEERKSRTSTKGGKKRQKRARSPSRSASLPPQKVLHTLSTISEGFEGKRPSVSRTGSSRSGSRKPGSRSGSRSRSGSCSGSPTRQNNPLQWSAAKHRQRCQKRSPRCLQVTVYKSHDFAAI